MISLCVVVEERYMYIYTPSYQSTIPVQGSPGVSTLFAGYLDTVHSQHLDLQTLLLDTQETLATAKSMYADLKTNCELLLGCIIFVISETLPLLLQVHMKATNLVPVMLKRYMYSTACCLECKMQGNTTLHVHCMCLVPKYLCE